MTMDSLTRRILEPIAKDSRVPEDVRRKIANHLATHAKKPGPARAMRKGPTKAQSKAKRDASHAAEWALIKMEVSERAESESGGRCEWFCPGEINDPHHLLGGSGRRRVEEAVDTVAGICRECHDGYEDNNPEVLERARKWAERHGFWRALGAIDRRIAKAKATQRYLDSQHGRATR